MKLDDDSIKSYRERGLVFSPDVFDAREIAALIAELDRLLSLELAAHLRAESGELLGTTAMHKSSPLYQRLLYDERLLRPAEQILGGAVYAHQYKVILKEPFGKLSLPWHQDYGPWRHHDGMLEPYALSFGLFLDDVTEFNGPIAYIPGSHRHGLIDYELIEVPGTTPIPSIPDTTVANLVKDAGMVSPKGTAGSMTLFDCCTAHGSGINMSPYPRRLIYVSYNLVSNAITRPTRPEHFALRDFTPLKSAPAENLVPN